MAEYDQERAEFLHYVHTWDVPGHEDQEMVASVSEMEEILKEQLFVMADIMLISDPEIPLFFHDHSNGAVLTEVTMPEDFGEGRQGLLRVVGCLHFLMRARMIQVIRQGRRFAETSRAWSMSDTYEEKCKEWLEGPLHPDAPCDPESCAAIEHEILAAGLAYNKTLPEDEQEYWDSRLGVNRRCRLRSFTSEEMADELPNEYREFLFMLMHATCVTCGPEPERFNEKLRQQYLILNRKHLMPQLPANTEIHSLEMPMARAEPSPMVKKWTTVGKKNLKHTRRLAQMRAAELQQQQLSAGNPEGTEMAAQQASGGYGAGQARTVSASQWQGYVNFSEAKWTAGSGGAVQKVVGQYWKLGCQGCPKTVVRNGRRRNCKWITYKKVVLVKRPVRRP